MWRFIKIHSLCRQNLKTGSVEAKKELTLFLRLLKGPLWYFNAGYYHQNVLLKSYNLRKKVYFLFLISPGTPNLPSNRPALSQA